jgi:hypothetical protein
MSWKRDEGSWITNNGIQQYVVSITDDTAEEVARVFDDDSANIIAASYDLFAELREADATICELCKRLNPQHAECNTCPDRESRLAAIANAERGK